MMAGDNVKNKVLEALGIVLLILFLFPFFIVVINAAKPADQIIRAPLALPQKWGTLFANMNRVIHSPNMNYWKSFFDSVIITVASLFTIVLFSSMAAWVLERNSIKHNNKKWANVIFYLLVASMVIPFQVVMLPVLSWYRTVGKFSGIGLLQSYKGSVFAYIGFGCAMSVFILHGFIKSIPLELEEAATIDGCTAEGVFGRVVLPLLQPIQITVLILNGIWIWNDYLLPSLLLGQAGKIRTLPIAVMGFVGSYVKQWDLILTSTLLAMLPVIVLFIFAQKYIIKGMVEGSIK
ncbi:MAG: carbohydrate ABC transporter permease [Treponema sp.]|nr:carbohydrate ABC transporter permease [Treponema sp.]MEE3435100.1 carbohydrate ABC transporter permease [Treponema sp.]